MTNRERFEIRMSARHDQRVAEAAGELDSLDGREQTLLLCECMERLAGADNQKERLIARMTMLGMSECLMVNRGKALQ